MGDYDQATADNSYFYTTWGDNRLGDAVHVNQPDVRFAKIPVEQENTLTGISAPAAATVPSALLSSDASWTALAVDAYFMDLAGKSQATSSDTKQETAGVSGTVISLVARRAAHGPAHDWATDVLTLAELS
jgi:hypothetical protein